MNTMFTREDITQFGAVVWDDVFTQWNPKKTDVYTHVVAVMKAGENGAYKAFKRHDENKFELVTTERTLDDAVDVLKKCFK